MSPGAHLLASWLIADAAGLERRERRLVAFAGLSCDLDGFGYLIDRVNELRGVESAFYADYHHLLLHGLLASLLVPILFALLARQRKPLVFALSFVAMHLHILGDLAGSRGPDGYQWPIKYLYPFDPLFELTWSGQWELNAWQNVAITLTMLALALWRGAIKRYSFVEVISAALDRAFFQILARRWPPRDAC